MIFAIVVLRIVPMFFSLTAILLPAIQAAAVIDTSSQLNEANGDSTKTQLIHTVAVHAEGQIHDGASTTNSEATSLAMDWTTLAVTYC